MEKPINHINPSHYKTTSKEVWEMMLAIWGPELFIAHCEMTAFKYKMRAGLKEGQPVERDLEKAFWYIKKAAEIKLLTADKNCMENSR